MLANANNEISRAQSSVVVAWLIHVQMVTGQNGNKSKSTKKTTRKSKMGCAPPRTTISGRRRLTWKKDLTTAPAPGGRSFRRSGPCRPSHEGTAGFESDPTHQKQKNRGGKWKLLLNCRRQHCICIEANCAAPAPRQAKLHARL